MPHTRKIIDCSKLRDLYLKERYSLFEISKLLGYSSRTIEIKAKECQIQLRKPGNLPPEVSNRALKHLYLRKKMSSRKIAKIYGCAYSYVDSRIKLLNIARRNLSTAHIISKRMNFSENKNEKAYLIGFAIGDLRVRKMYKNSETILIDCGSTKPNQIKLIKNLFKKYGRVWIGKPKKNGKTQIEIGVNESFFFLLQKYEVFPKWTLKNDEVFLNTLAGFIDAEGSFFLSKNKNSAVFSLGNYNKPILEQIKKEMHKYNIQARLFKGVKKGYTGKDGYSHKQDYWILSISKKKDLFDFIKRIIPYLKHKDRIGQARKALKNINIRNQKHGFIGM